MSAEEEDKGGGTECMGARVVRVATCVHQRMRGYISHMQMLSHTLSHTHTHSRLSRLSLSLSHTLTHTTSHTIDLSTVSLSLDALSLDSLYRLSLASLAQHRPASRGRFRVRVRVRVRVSTDLLLVAERWEEGEADAERVDQRRGEQQQRGLVDGHVAVHHPHHRRPDQQQDHVLDDHPPVRKQTPPNR